MYDNAGYNVYYNDNFFFIHLNFVLTVSFDT